MGAVDVYGAFQDFYWEQAASGTAMDKVEAISQSDPSLFSLGAAIAFRLLEVVAEVKAHEGAITVFKAVKGYYREVRAAAAIAEASRTARAAGTVELLAAREKLRATADETSGKPGLGNKILSASAAEAKSLAADLKQSLGRITDPALKELIIKDGSHGVITDPAGLMEYGLDAAGAKRSFDAAIREDPTREAGVFRDVATGEHVCVQGGHSFVETNWMDLPETRSAARRGSGTWSRITIRTAGSSSTGFRPGRISTSSPTTSARDLLREPCLVDDCLDRRGVEDPLETQFGYTPGAPRPYWTRYRVEDGTTRVASFTQAPSGAGAAEYGAWVNSTFTDPAAPVPGGNVMPVAPPLPPVPGGRPNVLPPPLPRRR